MSAAVVLRWPPGAPISVRPNHCPFLCDREAVSQEHFISLLCRPPGPSGSSTSSVEMWVYPLVYKNRLTESQKLEHSLTASTCLLVYPPTRSNHQFFPAAPLLPSFFFPPLLPECPAQTQPSAATFTKPSPLAIPTNHLLYPVLILTANIYEVLPRWVALLKTH